uniref:Uncharacterized protein n=1 Tax=viral metagenome TaxID=1070528 RepID=A0A6M3J1F3_9ZZZZ
MIPDPIQLLQDPPEWTEAEWDQIEAAAEAQDAERWMAQWLAAGDAAIRKETPEEMELEIANWLTCWDLYGVGGRALP